MDLQGSDGFKQCSEERNSLTRVLYFGEFHGVSHNENCTDLR